MTATTPAAHNLADNVPVTIAGASDAAYNVSNTTVTVTGLTTFQYEIVGSPADEPATSATASFTAGTVPVESDEFGVDYNLDAGTEGRLQSAL